MLDFDTDLLVTLQQTLEDSGFSAFIAWSEKDAVDLLATRYFDFFVAGNRPPKLNGRLIVQAIRERGIECGCYVIGAGRVQRDDFSKLLDCIRDYPCSAQNADEYVLDKVYAHETLAGVGYGN